MAFFSYNASKCVSMNNQECKIRPEIKNINSNEPLFYASCNSINDPYARICVPDVVKNIYIKVSNLMSRTNDKCHIE